MMEIRNDPQNETRKYLDLVDKHCSKAISSVGTMGGQQMSTVQAQVATANAIAALASAMLALSQTR